MFNFWKKKPSPGYDGDGIWYRCTNCKTEHEVEQTEEFRNLLQDLCTSVGDSSAQLYKEFEITDPNGFWDTDSQAGVFKFTTADGRVAHSNYGVVSSWNENTHSWFWSWDQPDDWLEPAVRGVGNRVLSYGREHHVNALTRGLLLVNEHEAWHLTKLAAHLSDMPLVYRARVNDINHLYFAMTRPVWAA